MRRAITNPGRPGRRQVAQRSAAEVLTGFAVILATVGFVGYAAVNTGHSAGARGLRVSARFDNIGSLAPGADVKVAGVAVGRVVSTTIDPASYQAVVAFTVQPDIKLPADSSATVSTGGLLGGSFLTLAPGGDEALIRDGGVMTITQSATNLEDLLGKFIFNVGSLADATQKLIKQDGAQGAAQAGSAVPDSGKP